MTESRGRRSRSRPARAYTSTAVYYDRIYSQKEYGAEARRVERWIRRYGRPKSHTLLDVACGTGNHLTYLARRFEATGVDKDAGMLRIARKKLPNVRFVRGRMESFRLGRRFDAITCLFSAVGYVRSEADLRRTLRNFARHLEPGGVAVIEPWFTPEQYRTGAVHAQIFGPPDDPIVRMNVSERRGRRSILDMHHLVRTRRGIHHFVERHDLGLFSVPTFLDALRGAGFRAQFRRRGLLRHRGIYLARLPTTRRPAAR